jgi:hypothetical protein
MTGHRPFKELTKGFSDARKTRIAALHSELRSQIALHEPRETRKPDRSPSIENFGGLADRKGGREDS